MQSEDGHPFQVFRIEEGGGRITEKALRAILPGVVRERKRRKERVGEKFTERRGSNNSGHLLGAYSVSSPVLSDLCINSFNP